MSNHISAGVINIINGKIFQKLRMRKGLKQYEIAQQVNCACSHISKLESGERTVSFVFLVNALPVTDASIGRFSNTFEIVSEEYKRRRPKTQVTDKELVQLIVDKLM